MPNPENGSENPIVSPENPLEAADANPGKDKEIKAKKTEAEDKKKESEKEKEKKKEPEKTWVEFQLLDADGKAVKGEKCKVTLPDGTVKDNLTTDNKGKVKIEKITAGTATIQLVDRYDYEWVFDRVEKGADD